MTNLAYVGPRKRTERTAMAECVRMVNDWWASLGHPTQKARALSARRQTNPKGWVVEYELIR